LFRYYIKDNVIAFIVECIIFRRKRCQPSFWLKKRQRYDCFFRRLVSSFDVFLYGKIGIKIYVGYVGAKDYARGGVDV